MDVLSLIGAALALAAILSGQLIDGGHLAGLLNASAFLIVVGGTMGAIMLQVPFDVFRRAFAILPWVFSPPTNDPINSISELLDWCDVARRDGLLGLEREIELVDDPFVQKGLQLLADGVEPDVLRNMLEVDIITKEKFDLSAARVFESMGGYAPTIGIIGAVMGLIHVMENLSDPSELGAGIATAFVATIYGVAFANLFLLPVSNKLRTLIEREASRREMQLEGFVCISEGENPLNIEVKLSSYLS